MRADTAINDHIKLQQKSIQGACVVLMYSQAAGRCVVKAPPGTGMHGSYHWHAPSAHLSLGVGSCKCQYHNTIAVLY